MTIRKPLPALIVILALMFSACTTKQDAEESTTSSTAAPATTQTTQATPIETTTTTVPAPMFEPASCEFAIPSDRSVECGWLEVPEDRTNPAGDTVRFHIAIFESESPDPAPDPVVYLEGGPGGDALEVVPLVFEDRFAHLLVDRDVIFFDQRGTGYSEPSLACPELRELGFEYLERDDVPTDELIQLQLETIEDCRDRLRDEGADLDAYTSANNAADLADLRLALGIEEWNLYGISYGTRLALTTMRDHPQGIRSVVLDSAYPPDVDLIAAAPANLDRALRKLFDGCAADDSCSTAYPNLESVFYQLISDLDQEPMRAPVTDVFTGKVYDAVFNGAGLGGVVFQSLYSADAIEVLPQLITNVAAGETYELSVLTSSFLANGEFASGGMQFSVLCHEEAGFTSPGAVEAALENHPQLEPIFATLINLGPAFFDICALWGAGQAPPLENAAVTAAIPTLVLAGEYDPITPPTWGTRAASTLERTTFVEFPGLGHGPSADDDCPKAILREFLKAPSETVSTSCVSQMGSPEFAIPGTPVPAVTLVPFSEQLAGSAWAGVVPEEWEQQGTGVWARALNGFDQTAVIQQLAAGTPPGLVLRLIGSQLGLGQDPQSTGRYESPLGSWSLYEGILSGAPATIGFIEVTEGTLLVALISPPAEADQLRRDVFFPALDAITIQ